MSSLPKQEELARLLARARELEKELADQQAVPQELFPRDYPAYAAAGGFMLGAFGAMVSLVFNVIGSVVAGKNPLELIRVYLTFPLGAKALELTTGAGTSGYPLNDGLIVAFGCCLYLGTGMLLGVPVALAISKFARRGSVIIRMIVGGIVALVFWGVNFYGILSWLQPLLFHGNWIVDNARLPWWVAAATHLVFGWTIALLFPLVWPGSEQKVASAAP